MPSTRSPTPRYSTTVGSRARGTVGLRAWGAAVFDVPQPPAGWPSWVAAIVMIGRDGSDTNVDSSFVGNLVVMLGDGSEPNGEGSAVRYDDRTFSSTSRTTTRASSPCAPLTATGSAPVPPSEFGVHRMVVWLGGVVSKHGAEPARG